MNKRYTSLLTTLLLSVFLAVSASAYDVMVDGIYYNILKKAKTAVVTKGGYEYSGDVIIPETITVDNVVCNVTSIEDATFLDCTSLTSIIIPNSVTSIGYETFSGCSRLTSITIPNSVTSIGEYAFKGCTSLTSITIPNSVTSIGDYAFQDCYGLTSVTIPNSVTSIGKSAFSYCSRLKSITIPNSVTSIGEEAFSYCSGLKSITISNSVTRIDRKAFRDCTDLTSVTIPNSVTSIGDYAFFDCTGITSITIPNSVTSIGGEAFSGCKNIENVYCYAETVPSTETDAFKGAYIEYTTLHVPESAINAYKTIVPWSTFGTFKTLEGKEVEKNKCETPTIAFADGKLTFSCATEDVEYVSEVKCSDVSKYYSKEISLAACYDISVTAMKTGYYDSDVATAKLYWLTSSGSLDSSINAAKTRGVVIQSAAGFITISGLDSSEQVDFFSSDGKSLGSAKAMGGIATFVAQSGSVVVAKIGKESVKIAVK